MRVKFNSLRVKKIFYLMVCFFIAIMFVLPANAETKKIETKKTEIKKKEIAKKINELKQKEHIQIKKLIVTQKNLGSTKNSIKKYKNKLWKSRLNMSRLQSRLNSLEKEHHRLSQTAKKRIRQIYMGERIDTLHVIFASQDLPTFFDRLYYQKSMINKDKELMAKLNQKANEIIRSQRSITYEKKDISSTLKIMNRKERRLKYSAQTSKYLINKLRTDRQVYEQAQDELEHLSKDIEKNLSRIISTQTILDPIFIKPIMGSITSQFGWRYHPIFHSTRFHSGIDIAGINRSPIKASNSGKVIHAGWYGGYGKAVIISHGIMTEGRYKGRKISTLYGHMSRVAVEPGNYVKKGQIIGYEGSTGYSTGPHVHFEVRVNGKPVNPLEFIRR